MHCLQGKSHTWFVKRPHQFKEGIPGVEVQADHQCMWDGNVCYFNGTNFDVQIILMWKVKTEGTVLEF